ncbi:MAG: hypothetical protein ACYCS7_15995 [Acidimicrobiales bacterium]
MQRLFKDEAGLASPVLAVFILFAVAMAVLAWTIIVQAQTTERELQHALAYSLKVAAIDGTTAFPNGAFLVDQATALTAAQQALPLALPVTLQAPTADGGTYQPALNAPTTWGTVTLSGFTIGNPAQSASSALCYGSSPDLTTCPYLQAKLTLDYSVSFLGKTMTFTAFVTDTQVLDTYDAQTQTYQ